VSTYKPLCTLFVPIKARFSTGAARVKLGYTGAHYPEHAAELEGLPTSLGWSRCGWRWRLLELGAYRQGLANGAIRSILSTGAVGDTTIRRWLKCDWFALALAPQHVWEPLDSRVQPTWGGGCFRSIRSSYTTITGCSSVC